jgi:hypothetical protein
LEEEKGANGASHVLTPIRTALVYASLTALNNA